MKKKVFLLVILIQCTLLSFTSYSQDASLEYNAAAEKNAFTGKMIDEEVRKLIDSAYEKTKALLKDKRGDVELLAKELLVKEVLFKSDVEALIGKRPYEEKKLLDIEPENVVSEVPPTAMPEELKNPPTI